MTVPGAGHNFWYLEQAGATHLFAHTIDNERSDVIGSLANHSEESASAAWPPLY